MHSFFPPLPLGQGQPFRLLELQFPYFCLWRHLKPRVSAIPFSPQRWLLRKEQRTRGRVKVNQGLYRQKVAEGEARTNKNRWWGLQVRSCLGLLSLHLLLFYKQANCVFSFPPKTLCLFSNVSVLSQRCCWSKMFDGVGKGEAFVHSAWHSAAL